MPFLCSRMTIISALVVGACARGADIEAPLDESAADGGNITGGGLVGSAGSSGTTGSSGAAPAGGAGAASSGASGGPGVSVGSGGTSGEGGAASSTGSGGTSGSGGGSGSGGASGSGGNAGSSGSTCDSAVDKGCPTGIAIGAAVPSPAFGGNGGSVFALACGPNQVLTGFDGRSDKSVDRLQPVCSTLTMVGSSFQVITVGATLLATEGGSGGSAFSDRCPANQVVIGIGGRQMPELERFSFICGSLAIARPSPSGPWQITVTRTMDSPQHGGTDGTVFEYVCPDGGVASGLGGRRGDRMDQASIGCSPLTLQTL
jgi:hypothetical protein